MLTNRFYHAEKAYAPINSPLTLAVHFMFRKGNIIVVDIDAAIDRNLSKILIRCPLTSIKTVLEERRRWWTTK